MCPHRRNIFLCGELQNTQVCKKMPFRHIIFKGLTDEFTSQLKYSNIRRNTGLNNLKLKTLRTIRVTKITYSYYSYGGYVKIFIIFLKNLCCTGTR